MVFLILHDKKVCAMKFVRKWNNFSGCAQDATVFRLYFFVFARDHFDGSVNKKETKDVNHPIKLADDSNTNKNKL